jgi:CDP-diacylglycerol--glycerol-3-phosphate 3-phosphatidyltransferase
MPTSPAQDLPLDKRTVRRSTLEELTNLPNVLTLMRIAAIAPVIALMVWDTPKTSFFAALLFGAAAATDWLDGWLARRRGQESLMGKLLDPLADKLIVMATLVIGAELGRIPGWFVVLLLSRELSITGLRAMASSEGLMIHVVETGKWKTALQLVGLVGLIVHYRYLVDFGFIERVVDFNALGYGLLLLSMVFSLASAGAYFNGFLKAIAARKEGIL